MEKGSAILIVAALMVFLSACDKDNKNTQENGVNTGQSGMSVTGNENGGSQTAIPSTAGTSGVQAGSGGNGGDGGGAFNDNGGASGENEGNTSDFTVDAGDTDNTDEDATECDEDAGEGPPDAGVSGEPDFDTCVASLDPDCDISTLDTADKIESFRCAALTFIRIPLADGSDYGPMKMTAGPYGGSAIWNAGADTEFANIVNPAEIVCIPIGIMTFAQPDEVNQQLYNLRDMDWALYTIYKPACFKEGEKYPVITWANGTCGEQAGYAALLATVASHGFVIISSNSTWTGTPPTNTVQTRALDFAEALNEDPDSELYQKLDLERIGAMGHSQGAMATTVAASDPRIDSLILWNAGTSNEKPFLNVSGDGDIGGNTPLSMAAAVNASTQPAAWVYTHKTLNTGGVNTGHLVLMEQPDRVWELAVAWWKYMLKDDPEAKKMFVGNDCGFCNMADEFEYGANSLLN